MVSKEVNRWRVGSLTIRQPRDIAGERRVQGARGDENSSINNSWGRARYTHDEPYRHDAETDEDKGVALSNTVTKPGYCNGEERGSNIDWNSQELRRRTGVSKAFDDGRQEKRDAIERADDA